MKQNCTLLQKTNFRCVYVCVQMLVVEHSSVCVTPKTYFVYTVLAFILFMSV